MGSLSVLGVSNSRRFDEFNLSWGYFSKVALPVRKLSFYYLEYTASLRGDSCFISHTCIVAI